MDTEVIEKARKWGKIGGKKTLATFGKAHFSKAANARWKKYRLAKKLNGKTKKTK